MTRLSFVVALFAAVAAVGCVKDAGNDQDKTASVKGPDRTGEQTIAFARRLVPRIK
jgi:hypothetical protein